MTPYRDTGADEVTLREEQRSVRRAHDHLAEQVDELGRRLAELEEGGPLATVMEWLSADRGDERRALRKTLAAHEHELEGLVTREREIVTALAALDAERAARSQQVDAQIAHVRASDGPLAESLRALDAERTNLATRIAAIDATLAITDRAERATTDIRAIVDASAGAPGELLARVIDLDLMTPSDRDIARSRLREHLPFVRDVLRELVTSFEALGLADDQALRLARGQLTGLARSPDLEPPERAELVVKILSAASCTYRLSTAAADARRVLAKQRDGIATRERALVT